MARKFEDAEDGSITSLETSHSHAGSTSLPINVGCSPEFEAELNRLNRIYWVMSACYQSMLYTTRRATLLQRTCDLITKIGGFLSVQIGFVSERKGRHLTIQVEAQAEGEGLGLFRLLLEVANAELNPILMKRTIRTRKPTMGSKMVQLAPEAASQNTTRPDGLLLSSIALPIIDQEGQVNGALCILAGGPEAFNPDEIELLAKLARDLGHKLASTEKDEDKNQPAFMSWLVHERALDLPNIGIADPAVRSKVLNAFDLLMLSYPELSYVYDSIIEGWSHTLDLRDNGDTGHSQRVADLTQQLAREFGVGEEDLIHIRRGALLHDIGKVGIPDNILNKPGPLNDKEWTVMRMHPVYAFKLLSPIEFLQKALDIPYCHHEHWDGNGYPRGLQGEAIPIAARIFAVVDVWDALLANRPYRDGWTEQQALSYIESQSGKDFDPQIVRAFLSYIAKR